MRKLNRCCECCLLYFAHILCAVVGGFVKSPKRYAYLIFSSARDFFFNIFHIAASLFARCVCGGGKLVCGGTIHILGELLHAQILLRNMPTSLYFRWYYCRSFIFPFGCDQISLSGRHVDVDGIRAIGDLMQWRRFIYRARFFLQLHESSEFPTALQGVPCE